MYQLGAVLPHVDPKHHLLIVTMMNVPAWTPFMPFTTKANALHWLFQSQISLCLQSECNGVEATCTIDLKDSRQKVFCRQTDFGHGGIAGELLRLDRFGDLFSVIGVFQSQHHFGIPAPIIQRPQS